MSELVEVSCPCCHCTLWVDSATGQVIRSENPDRRTDASFDDLLKREKDKKEQADRRFSMARELEQEKKRRAAALFQQGLREEHKDPDDPS